MNRETEGLCDRVLVVHELKLMGKFGVALVPENSVNSQVFGDVILRKVKFRRSIHT